MTFFGKMRQIFDPLFEHDSKSWLFHKIPIIEPYFENWLHRIQFLKVILSIELFFFEKTLKELQNRTLLRYHSNDWFFFVENMTQRIELSFLLNLTQRIVPPFFHGSNTWTFFTWLKELNLLFYVTQILELFREKKIDSKKWTFFSRLKVFYQKKKKTHRIDFYCELNRWISWVWRKEFNRLISCMTQRFEPFFEKPLKEFIFLKKSQRIELFDEYDLKN